MSRRSFAPATSSRPRRFLGLVALMAIASGVSLERCRAELPVTSEDRVAVERHADWVTVTIDGKPFTEYRFRSGAKPILWPIHGPSGEELTRGYPMRPAIEHEKEDHIHHRSFWFTHGDVNGVSFWDEQPGHGTIEQRELVTARGGETATIVTINDWRNKDGTKICEDRRTLEFGDDELGRWIDFTVVVRASEGELVFGDTKEGAFGLRVAGSMKVDEKLGGRIESSEGLIDGATWGKPAKWVDYSGPVGERTVGITIMDHPTSHGHPVHWHVRTYGLFAANPFGLHDFYTPEAGKFGALILQPGESFTLRYRVVLHDGPLDRERTEQAYAEWSRSEGRSID